jgi:hypothetical protein
MSRVSLKTLKIGVIVLVVAVMLITIASVSLCFLLRPPGIEQMHRSFQLNREEIQLVTDYLLGTELVACTIFIHSEQIRTHDIVELQVEQVRIPIRDDRVSNAIHHLSMQGYVIVKMRGDEGVSFLKWTHFEQGRGIAYMPHGRIHDGEGLLPFMIELKPLSEDGWYFYVEWFSLWKRQQPQQ